MSDNNSVKGSGTGQDGGIGDSTAKRPPRQAVRYTGTADERVFTPLDLHKEYQRVGIPVDPATLKSVVWSRDNNFLVTVKELGLPAEIFARIIERDPGFQVVEI